MFSGVVRPLVSDSVDRDERAVQDRVLVDCCLTGSLALIDLRVRPTRPDLQHQPGKAQWGSSRSSDNFGGPLSVRPVWAS